jgi:HEAT repeats
MIERYAKLVVAVAVALCCALSACKGCGEKKRSVAVERPSLASVTVNPIAPTSWLGQDVQVDRSQLSAKATQVLEGAKIFAAPEAKRPTARVSLEVEVFSSTGPAGSEIGAKVRLRIAVRPSVSPARFAEDVAGMGRTSLPKGDVEDIRMVFQRLAERTISDLLQAYVARQKLWEAAPREIDSALQSSDNDLRVEAVRIVAARNLREEIPTLLRLLSDEEEDVRDAALGALVALRERSAVKVLAESRQMRDAREMRKILDAMAALGGREAQEYLSFVAETHDDEEIRTMAKEAIERLQRLNRSNQTTK